MDLSKKYVSVKRDKEFRYLFKKGKSVVNSAFVVTSKKIGNAVKRSRARRVLREAFRILEPQLRAAGDRRYDFIFVARGKTPYMKSNKLYGIMKKQIAEEITKANDN